MERTRPMLYGVADYAEIRRANAWSDDRTAKIRDLEATRYALFSAAYDNCGNATNINDGAMHTES